jgi:hypothetical protein
MACAVFLLILFAVGGAVVCLILLCRGQDEKTFKPRGRVKGTVFGMRAAGHVGGRMRTGPICFVTGMSRTECTCAHCQGDR